MYSLLHDMLVTDIDKSWALCHVSELFKLLVFHQEI